MDTSTLLSPTSKALATASRRSSYRRKTSALRTNGSGFSSWPTPQAYSRGKDDNSVPAYSPLDGAARAWPSPTAEDAESSQSRRPGDVTLTEAAQKLWPSPVAAPNRGRTEDQVPGEPWRQVDLEVVARQWQTPGADSFRSRGGDRVDEMGLDQQARRWPSPTVPNGGRTTNDGVQDPDKAWHQVDLEAFARRWPTPDAGTGSETRDRKAELGRPATGSDLAGAAQNWPTPDTQNGWEWSPREEAEGRHAVSLHHAVEQWQTPTDPRSTTRRQVGATEREGLLASQARTWKTPTSSDGKSQACVGQRRRLLSEQAELLYTPPGPADPEPSTTSDGNSSSTPTPDSRRLLNPLFVAWLMGWPVHWFSPLPVGKVR